jgi:hypothetical protein
VKNVQLHLTGAKVGVHRIRNTKKKKMLIKIMS